jgi:hypothetical protein
MTVYGKTLDELADIIDRDELLASIRDTKAYKILLLKGAHEAATRRMVEARNLMNNLNNQIKKLEGN